MTRIVIERINMGNLVFEDEDFEKYYIDLSLKFDTYELTYENTACAGLVSMKDNGREVFELQNFDNFFMLIRISENPALWKNQKYKGSLDSYYNIEVIVRKDFDTPDEGCACSACNFTSNSREYDYEIESVVGNYTYLFGKMVRQFEKHKEPKTKELSDQVKKELK